MLKFPEAGKIAPSTRAEEADSAMAARSRQTGCAEFGCATTQIVRVSQTHMRNTQEYNVVVDNLRKTNYVPEGQNLENVIADGCEE